MVPGLECLRRTHVRLHAKWLEIKSISGLEHSRIIKEPKLRPLEIKSRVFENQAEIRFRTLEDWNGAKSQMPKDRIEIGPKLDSRCLRDLIRNVFK
jgi:hypothetical protein